MIRARCCRGGALLLFLSALLPMFAPPLAAQETDRPCVEAVAPADDLQSAGIGLTSDELVALYGEGEIGQGSIIYDFQGVDLHSVGCDLVLSFPADWSGVEQVQETALAESLLPADAELVGTIALGTTIASFEANTLWRSPSLADRFANMGENRSGEILIVYTYEPMAEAIQRVELRTLELPS